MGGQTSPWRTANAVAAVKLDIQRIKGVTARTDGNSNRIGIFCDFLNARWSLVFRFIQLKAYLREVVELGNSATFDFGSDTTFQDTVEKGIDVRFFGEVDEGFGIIRGLHFFEILDDFLETLVRTRRHFMQNIP